MLDHVKLTRDRLSSRIEENAIVILYSGKPPHKSADQFYAYEPQRNFYYLTNLQEPNLVFVMIKGQDDFKSYLFIEENTEYIIQWEGARISKEEASKQSGIDIENIRYLTQFESFIGMVMNYARSPFNTPPKHLYLDLYHVGPQEKPIALAQADWILNNYRELNVHSVNEHTSYLRMFKSAGEVELLKSAVMHTKVGLNTILSSLKTRQNEYQLEADFLHAITLNGSQGNAFQTIAASGKNATVLHYVDNNSTLSNDDLILFDLGAMHDCYCADISRTYPISGKFTDRQKTLYSIVLDVNKACIEFVKPGVTWPELNAYAKKLLIKKTKAIGLIKDDEEISRYYYHSIGHFLGLDVHDVGHYHLPFEPGMVITIEPGLYIAEEGIGIRIEDDILVTETGSVNLSASIIKEIEDIENFMKEA